MRDSINNLTQLPEKLWKPRLKVMADTSPSALVRIWAFSGLVAANDWSSYAKLEPLLLSPPPDLHYAAAHLFSDLEDHVRAQNGDRLLEPIPASVLISLMKSKDLNVRQPVSYLLSTMEGPNVVRALINSLITDKDNTVRNNCICGLNSLTRISSELWTKEPELARKVYSDRSRGLPLSIMFTRGEMFDQDKITSQLSTLFNSVAKEENRPAWLDSAVEVVRSNRALSASLLNDLSRVDSFHTWGWEGQAEKGKKISWYTYKKMTYPPTGNADQFSFCLTTVAFLVECKNDKYPEMTLNTLSSSLLLPPAKILDIWQQDDNVTFIRKPNNKIYVLNTRRLYGEKGSPVESVPSGRQTEATFRPLIEE